MTRLPLPSTGALLGAEIRKLSTRWSARLGLLAMVGIGLGVPLVMFALQQQMGVSDEAAAAGATPMTFAGGTAVRMVLNARNLFVFRALLIAVVAVSVAGEFVARTLREDLVRPVSRTQVLVAKWGAIQAFVMAGAVVPFSLAVPLSALLFGTDDLFGAAPGFALTWLGDVGFATLVVAISLGFRSVPGTIVGVFLYWVLDQLLSWALWGAAQIYPFIAGYAQQANAEESLEVVQRIIGLRPYLPSAAFNLYWDYAPDQPFPWRNAAALAAITAVSALWSWWWFRRIDVD